MESAFSHAEVTLDERKAWHSEIIQDFYTSNLQALPINEQNVNYHKVFVDSRSFMETVQHLAINQQQTSQQVGNITHRMGINDHMQQQLLSGLNLVTQSLNTLTQELHLFRNEVRHFQSCINTQSGHNGTIMETTIANNTKDTQICTSKDNVRVLEWSNLKMKLDRARCPIELFTEWHIQCAEISYHKWKELQPTPLDRTHVNFHHKTGKICKSLEILSGQVVKERPNNDAMLLAQWERGVKDIATIGMSEAKEKIPKENNKTVNKTDLLSYHSVITKENEA